MRQEIKAQTDSQALAHSKKMCAHLRERIDQADGKIPFVDYMQQVLYAPGLGYYMVGNQKIGAGGDFITAPELSPLFSQCLARACKQSLKADDSILEFGAGTGAMAAQILLYLDKLNQLPEQYYILELSAHLKQIQKETLSKLCPELLKKVTWLDSLPQDNSFSGIILANEVIDAMPVHLVRSNAENKLQEAYVSYDNKSEQFILEFSELSNSDLKNSFSIDLANYQTEINLLQAAWLQSLSQCLKRGTVIIIDYGFEENIYFHPQRSMGTLMCHYQHQAHDDIFHLPGLQDITTHVNFSALAKSAEQAGFKVAGYTNQASYLLSLGLCELAISDDIETQYKLAQQVKTLTLPSEMGELFKVIALTKNHKDLILGFEMQDLTERL